jgi:hypothetical protein
MTLENYQTALSLGNLYKISIGYTSHGGDQKEPNLWINSGTIDLYTSNSATQPTSLADMTLATDDTNVSADKGITRVIKYIAIVQNTGTTTEIISSGIDVAPSLGPIS